MVNPEDKYYYLALSYFEGKISLAGEKLLFEFITARKENYQLFRQWEKEWILTSGSSPAVQKEWKKLERRLEIKEIFRGMFPVNSHFVRRIIAAAAILFLIAGSTIGIKLLVNSQTTTFSFVTQPGEKSNVVLPDSTAIWLNADSHLSYASSFTGKNQTLFLEGEAYFEVSRKNPKQNFHIKTQHFEIIIKGTRFNVTTYKEDPVSTITLLQGSIELLYGENKIPISPGEAVHIDNTTGEYSRHKVRAEQYRSWIDGRIEYDEITLMELMVRLSRKYDVKIHLEDELQTEETFRVSLRNEETIDQFLQALSQVIAIRFERKDREIMITKQ